MQVGSISSVEPIDIDGERVSRHGFAPGVVSVGDCIEKYILYILDPPRLIYNISGPRAIYRREA